MTQATRRLSEEKKNIKKLAYLQINFVQRVKVSLKLLFRLLPVVVVAIRVIRASAAIESVRKQLIFLCKHVQILS